MLNHLAIYDVLQLRLLRTIYLLYRVKNSRSLHKTFNVEPLYLQHENSGRILINKQLDNYYLVS